MTRMVGLPSAIMTDQVAQEASMVKGTGLMVNIKRTRRTQHTDTPSFKASQMTAQTASLNCLVPAVASSEASHRATLMQAAEEVHLLPSQKIFQSQKVS